MFPTQKQNIDQRDQVENENSFINYFQKAKSMLCNLLQFRNRIKNESLIEDLITNFNIFVDTSNDIFKFLTTSPYSYSWVQIKSTIRGWEDIADIALRIQNSGTSEASCERSIKKQHLIHSKRRLKSKKDLLDARMIHSSIYY